jgi:hypothetical protein
MAKQMRNETSIRSIEEHTVELIPSPAMQAQTSVDMATLNVLVQKQVAEILARHDEATFEPRFRDRQVAYALRRMQTVSEQRVSQIYYERFGCEKCETDDRPHFAIGMCARCYARIGNRRRVIRRELSKTNG